MVPQPRYSPDLSPRDFFLFPRLKNHLKWRHFGTLDNIQKSVTDELKGIQAETFQHCYVKWKEHLCRCVAAQGYYFKGYNLDLYKRIKFMVKRKSVSLLYCHTTYFSGLKLECSRMHYQLSAKSETFKIFLACPLHSVDIRTVQT